MINEEVNKLLQAKAIQELEYPDWLASVVLIKKANGKWRLYTDFTYVNRAYPKDSFPLPRINLIVDEAGYLLLPGDAFRVEERWGHLSEASEQNVSEVDWSVYGGIYR